MTRSVLQCFEALEARRLLAVVPFRWAGERDPLMASIAGGQSDQWYDLVLTQDAQTQDEKIVVVGQRDRVTHVQQFNPDGTADAAFAGGDVAINFGSNWETASRILIQPDGKIVVAGVAAGTQPYEFPGFFGRINPDGTLDDTFHDDGVALYDLGDQWGTPSGLGLQSTGKILALSDAMILARLNADGTLDSEFGEGGLLRPVGSDEDSWNMRALIVLDDDRFYVAGSLWNDSATASVGQIMRFLPHGQLDPTFAGAGVLEIDLNPGTWDRIGAAAVQPDGSLVLALETQYVDTQQSIHRLTEVRRYFSDGTHDTAFGVDGVRNTAGYARYFYDLDVDSQGRIVFTGEIPSGSNGEANRGLYRLTPDGTPDPLFGVAGRAVDGFIKSFAIESDDDIVGIISPSGSPRVIRVFGEPRGDGPVHLDPATGKLWVTGTPNGDEILLNTVDANLVVTLNGQPASVPLATVTSLEVQARLGNDHIVYDVGEALAGATNVLDAGPTLDVPLPPPGAANRVEILSGPATGTVHVRRDPDLIGSSTFVTVLASATADVTVDQGQLVTLHGGEDADTFDWTPLLTTSGGTVVRGIVSTLQGSGGDDLFFMRGSNSFTIGPSALGGPGNDIIDAFNGRFRFDGSSGHDRFALGPSGPALASSGSFATTQVHFGPTRIEYADVEEITINGSSGNDTLDVAAIPAGLELLAQFGDGNDKLTIGVFDQRSPHALVPIAGVLTADLGSGAGDIVSIVDGPATSFPWLPSPTRPARFTLTDATILPEDDTLFGDPGAIVTYTAAEVITTTLGKLGDEVAVMPSASARFEVNSGEPATAPGDGLFVVLSGATGVELESTGVGAGRYTFDNRQPIAFSGIERSTLDGSGDFQNPALPDATGLALIVHDAQVTLTTPHRLAALHISANADVAIAPAGVNVLQAGLLTIEEGGHLQVADNDLILNYASVSPVGIWTGSTYDGITGYIQSGRIMSSAASGNLKKLGVAEAREVLGITGTQTGTFAGQVVDSTAVLVKFTWGGDANLDGVINIDDYGRIDANVAVPDASGWFNGDFNYDGKINIDDYGIIDSNVAAQGGPLPAAGPVMAAAPPSPRKAEPEDQVFTAPSVCSSFPAISDEEEDRLWAIDRSVDDLWA